MESNFKKLYAKTIWFPESFADPELTETSFKSCQISVPVLHLKKSKQFAEI